MTWIKICGTTNLEDALVAVEAGADALGFVFYESSPRYITPKAAYAIASRLPSRIEKVGVFVNTPTAYALGIAAQVGLSAIQIPSPNILRDIESWPSLPQTGSQIKLIFALAATSLKPEFPPRLDERVA